MTLFPVTCTRHHRTTTPDRDGTRYVLRCVLPDGHDGPCRTRWEAA